MTFPELDPAIAQLLKRDQSGLVAAVVQDDDNDQVLMVGWMDDEALRRTLTSGRVTFWSRSRGEYWRKGDISGHAQYVRSVAIDCDGDALVVRVHQIGAACHTGERTCFFRELPAVRGEVPGAARESLDEGDPDRTDVDEQDVGAHEEAARATKHPASDSLTPDLTLGVTWPDASGFERLAASRRVIPVVRRLLADGETPLGVYRKLAGDAPGTFLLESAEQGQWDRYSFIGANSRATLTEKDGQAHWLGTPPVGLPTSGDPLAALKESLQVLASDPVEGLPPMSSGLVGHIAYDAVRRWEPSVPNGNPDELGIPELAMNLVSDLAVFDHRDDTVLLVANAINWDATDERVEEAYRDAVARLDAMTDALATPSPSAVAVFSTPTPEPTSDRSPEQFMAVVETAKEHIRAGDIFQVVPSHRFSLPCEADPLEVYRVLRVTNPSPYMYLFRFERPDGTRYDVVGSSPEALVRVNGDRVITHPIAGSRPRSEHPATDLALEAELLADAKERAEHVMLVDLSRNDLQRVCRPGTVDVVEFMAVRRYSHVMHIESTVEGVLAPGHDAYDVLAATFPAGTLSGAPKTSAMRIIDEQEASRRGVYGGVVGYLDVHGDLDVAIAIRTAVITGGRAYVQTGAGIVADSVPRTEYAETVAKATAVLRAVAAASTMEGA